MTIASVRHRPSARLRVALSLALAALVAAGCGTPGDTRTAAGEAKAAPASPATSLDPTPGASAEQNLWHRKLKPAAGAARDHATVTLADVQGYWEGNITTADVRMRIDGDRLTLAMNCSPDAKIVAQSAARVEFVRDDPPKLVLLEDMKGEDPTKQCWFRFFKDNEFRINMNDSGFLMINFAGNAIAYLKRLTD